MDTCCLTWYVYLAVVAAVIWCLKDVIYRGPYQLFSAWLINKTTRSVHQTVKKQKVLMFQPLEDYRQKVNRDLKILEVGSGSVSNLEHFPADSELVCLDPNPFLEKYANKNINSQGEIKSVEFVSGFSEDIPLESNTFDIVVCTFVLCSVSDVAKSLQEMYRVMKPGGLFIFLDHVAAENDRWTRLVQTVLSPLNQVVFDGCCTNRETEKKIQDSAMKDVHIERFRADLPFWISYCIFGNCSK